MKRILLLTGYLFLATLGDVKAEASLDSDRVLMATDTHGCQLRDPRYPGVFSRLPLKNTKVNWTGNCKDGRADGPGVAAFDVVLGGDATQLEGSFVAGFLEGVGKKTDFGGSSYEGEFKRSLYWGHGKLNLWDGTVLQGDFEAGHYIDDEYRMLMKRRALASTPVAKLPEQFTIDLNLRLFQAFVEPEPGFSYSPMPPMEREVIPDKHYHLCKELSQDVHLQGLSAVNRYIRSSDRIVVYQWKVLNDVIMKQNGSVEAQFKILEVLDSSSIKCPVFDSEDGFALKGYYGPSFGWTSRHGYISMDGGQNGSAVGDDLEVLAPDTDGVYCTHKIIIDTAMGDLGINVLEWTAQRMRIGYGVQSRSPIFDKTGSSLGLTLYVKFVPDRSKFQCDPLPPPRSKWSAPIHPLVPSRVRQPDGSFQFVFSEH